MMKKYVLALDLIDNEDAIAAYEAYHKTVWPEILKSIKDAGICDLEIYRVANRLVMLMLVNEDFSFDKKAKMDEDNVKVQEWETLMWNYQQAIPGSKPGEKWRLMDQIFKL